MASAQKQLTTYVCDRCGRSGSASTEGPFYEGGIHIRDTGAWLYRRNAAFGAPAVKVDLCRRCSGDFMAWLKSPLPMTKESVCNEIIRS